MENLSQEFAEVARRKMGMQPSGAGIPNQSGMSPSGMGNPIETSGMNKTPQAQSSGNPLALAASGLDQAKAGQADIILKSLTKYLDKLVQ